MAAGAIAVDRAEIALPVDQRQAHGKILRHAHHRVINGLVAVRMIFADHVADDAGGFAVRLVPLVAVLVHRIEDAPVHRLEPVARIGQRARDDHAHRVIEIASASSPPLSKPDECRRSRHLPAGGRLRLPFSR